MIQSWSSCLRQVTLEAAVLLDETPIAKATQRETRGEIHFTDATGTSAPLRSAPLRPKPLSYCDTRTVSNIRDPLCVES